MVWNLGLGTQHVLENAGTLHTVVTWSCVGVRCVGVRCVGVRCVGVRCVGVRCVGVRCDV